MFTKFVATAATLLVAVSLSLTGVSTASAADPTDTPTAPASSAPVVTDAPTPSVAPTDPAPVPIVDTISTDSAPAPVADSTSVCIPNSAVDYSYDPATNGGDIVVHDVANSTGVLCSPFWVTATSWRYTTGTTWPQIRDIVDKLPKISIPGTYHFAAAVTCGQGDIYASTEAQPDPSSYLTSPGKPFHEEFLFSMGFNGPLPTYTWDSPSCNVVTPVAPTATAITQCGVYGNVSVPADSESVSYTVTGSGLQGTYVVTAKVLSPYTLAGGATTTWTFQLGSYVKCAVACSVINAGHVSTNLDNAGWAFGESKGSGAHKYVSGGLEVSTAAASSADKSAGYIATDFPLSDAGDTALDFTNTSGGAAPGLQLTVYVNGTFFGNLVNEPLFPQWWSSHAVAGMPAGPNPSYQHSYGSLNDYLYAWAQAGVSNVRVEAVGYSLGSGAKGDGVITRISADCMNYTFGSQMHAPAASYTLGDCYPNDGFSSKNLSFVFDNSGSDVPVTFTVASTNISVVVPAHTSRQVDGTPIWDQGGGYDVFADGILLRHLTIPSFVGCLAVTPSDPTATPQVCKAGVISDGSILVTLQPGLVYSIVSLDGTPDSGPSISIPVVTTAATKLPAGDYLVSVAAEPGFALTGAESWPFTLSVASAGSCGDLPTFSVQPVNVTSTSAFCTTNGSNTGTGTITVGQVGGVDFTPFVKYAIDGVAATSITTAVAPGTHVVTAAAAIAGDTLEGPNTLADGTARWTVTISAALALCGELKTLALPVDGLATTGTNESGWLIAALILLQLGVVLIVAQSRAARRRIGRNRSR